MTAATADAPAAGAFVRDRATWYGWLSVGVYIYLLNVQGNVLPFLQSEFALSYRAVSLHSTAIALGIIAVGLFGERVAARLGRRVTLQLALAGLAIGAILLCVSPSPVASIGSCFIMAGLGTLIPSVVPALLADIHGARRDQAYAGQAITAYAFAITAPLATGLFVAVGLGWRSAVLTGALIGLGIVLWFRSVPIVEPPVRSEGPCAPLPAAFWAYWGVMTAACAIEFTILFWAPAFLERVAGFPAATAATVAAGFPLGVLIGRIGLGIAVRRVSGRVLLVSALGVTLVGFLVYWGIDHPAAALIGIFLLGLGVAPLYPLTMNFAIGAAPGATDVASTRLTLAFGVSILIAPIALGALADEVGLSLAHLTLPGLVAAAFLSFVAARLLEGPVKRQAP